jgi:hypothetical protein
MLKLQNNQTFIRFCVIIDLTKQTEILKMTFPILPTGYVRLMYVAADLRSISAEYVVHISTHTIGRIDDGGVVVALQPFQVQRPAGTLFFKFDSESGEQVFRASTVYSLIVDRLGDVLTCR